MKCGDHMITVQLCVLFLVFGYGGSNSSPSSQSAKSLYPLSHLGIQVSICRDNVLCRSKPLNSDDKVLSGAESLLKAGNHLTKQLNTLKKKKSSN